MITAEQFHTLAAEIHASNVAAGWWSDLHTGESILHTRNRPEVMMLIQSELLEAWEGFDGRRDDHLPQYPMFDVELADAVIRLFDLIGADVAQDVIYDDEDIASACRGFDEDGLIATSLGRHYILLNAMGIVNRAFENYRKSRRSEYAYALCAAVVFLFAWADAIGIDLLTVIDAKRNFNKSRKDHKREHRLADGGKVL